MQELDPVQRRRDADDQSSEAAAPGHGSLATTGTVCEAGRSGQNAPSTSVLEVSDDGRHGEDENAGHLFADDSRLATEGLLSARDVRNGHVETDPPSSSVTGNREWVISGALSSSNVGPPGDVIRDGSSAIENAAFVEVVSPISNLQEPLVSSTAETPVEGTAEPPVAGTAEPPVAGTGELLVVESPEPQGEPHLVQENVTVGLLPLNDSIDEIQQEPAAPVEKSNVHKKRHAEAVQDSSEYDSVVCPICMEAWTNSGDHQICSLACGHLFGSYCIKRWLQQAGRKNGRTDVLGSECAGESFLLLSIHSYIHFNACDIETRTCFTWIQVRDQILTAREVGCNQCPHCNKRAKLEDVRTLYVPHVAVVDGESQQLVQEVHVLRAENHQLKLENAKLLKEVQQHKERNALSLKPFTNGSINYDTIEVDTLSLGDSFVLKTQKQVHGGKVFDMDGDGQTVLFSNKVQGCGTRFGLSKMSLLACTEIEKIDLPLDFGAIRDIRISSGFGGPGKLALVASAGKKLSVMSMESNNIVLTYSVQSAPWSCAWDPCVPNLLYSGLQNGSLLMLDLRQTSSPVAVLSGPSDRPIHTLQVVPDWGTMQANTGNQSGSREILSASTTGIFRWNLRSSAATGKTIRPQCVCSVKDKVCISLAYEGSIDTAVGSFRQSPLVQTEPSTSYTPGSSVGQSSSQPLDDPEMCKPPPDAINLGDPSHWVFNRGLENSWSRGSERSSPGKAELHWQWVGGMVGHKSQSSLLPRGAIISKWKSTSGSKSLFAGGDEGTNRVWLWDMESFSVIDTLDPPHQSPVLDIKNVQIQGRDLMGSMSGSNFHLHQRCSTAV